MKKLNFFLLIMISTITFEALSFCPEGEGNCIEKKDCSPLDIRDKMNPKLRKFFSTPQKQLHGWCYAFSAVDILSVYLGEPVSVFHVATIFNAAVSHQRIQKNRSDVFQTSGIPFLAISVVLKRKKICKELELPYDYYSSFYFTNDNENYKKLFETIKRAKTSFADGNHRLDYHYAHKQINLALQNFFGTSKLYDKLVSRIITKSIDQFFPYLLDELCQNPLEVNSDLTYDIYVNLNYSYFNPEQQNSINHLIDTALGLSANDLSSPSAIKKIEESLERGYPVDYIYAPQVFYKNKNATSLHANTIVARRWNQKKNHCEFKIRDSQGKDCSIYKKRIECIKEEGSFWISDRELYNSIILLAFYDEYFNKL